MRKLLLNSLFVILYSFVPGQVATHHFTIAPGGQIDLSQPHPDYFPQLMNIEMPKPGGIEYPNALRETTPPPSGGDSTPQNEVLSNAALGMSFFGNGFANSTPNDNDMAISNGGKIISVINSTMWCYDIYLDTTIGSMSLATFTAPLGLPHQEFDPKVIYDPIEDKFALVCLNGFTDSTNSVIVAFSQTNNPMGAWNLYALPGDALNNNLWTDYPIIALSTNELFISGNLLYNDSTWQAGFVESIVWQINKQDGYSGGPLTVNLVSNILLNNRAIRNLCPVKGGSYLYGPEMFFVSDRNFENQCDTFFVVKISDTIASPSWTLTVKQLNSNRDYFVAGDALQQSPHKFTTNDQRVLGSFLENNKLQFACNTKDTAAGLTAIYHGIIDNPDAVTPIVTGHLIADTLLHFGYPNISYAGNSASDNTAIITFDHCAPTVHAGVSAIKTDGAGNYSNILKIRDGASYVNVLSSLLERWGDYSGSQRRYNNPGEVWMSGYYGYFATFQRKHGAWIAQVFKDQSLASIGEQHSFGEVKVYPNPAPEFVEVEFSLAKQEYLSFELFDISGKSVLLLLRERVKPGINKFSFSVSDLPAGMYVLRIHGSDINLSTKKIIKP